MTAKKDKPAKRGRKPAPPDSKTEPFTIRLTPRLRYGIELLARAQSGRSNSQVVEWALQRALNSVTLMSGVKLGDLLDTLWETSTEWQRLEVLFEQAPELLTYVERAICETIYGSEEFKRYIENDGNAITETMGPNDSVSDMYERAETAFHELIERHWERLKEIVTERELQGKDTENTVLGSLLRIEGSIYSLDELEQYLAGEN